MSREKNSLLWMTFAMVLSCGRTPPARPVQEDPLVLAVREAERRAADVAVVGVTHGRLLPLPVHARVLVTPDGISVDNTSELQQWSFSLRAQKAREAQRSLMINRTAVVNATQGVVEVAQVRGGANGFVLPALQTVLQEVHAVTAMNPTRDARTLLVHIDRSVPLRFAWQTLYTIGSSGYQRVVFAVRDASGTPKGFAFVFPSMEASAVAMRAANAAVQALEEATGRLGGPDTGASEASLRLVLGSRPAPAVSERSPLTSVERDPILALTANGVEVWIGSRLLEPDCVAVRSFPGERRTLENLSGAVAPERISSCLSSMLNTLVAAGQRPPEKILLRASGVTFGALLRVATATSETPEHRPLFSALEFSVQ